MSYAQKAKPELIGEFNFNKKIVNYFTQKTLNKSRLMKIGHCSKTIALH